MIRMSSKTAKTPSSPSITWSSFSWKISGAGETPKATLFHTYLPNGVAIAVSLDDSLSLTCQYPFLASHTVKIFALDRRGSRSSTTGIGYVDLLRALLRGLGSRHNRSFLFFFLSTTRAETHSVGLETLAITPMVSNLSSSDFTSSLSASGNRLAACFVDWIEPSTSRCTDSAMHPSSSEKTSEYCLSTVSLVSPFRFRLSIAARFS